MNYKPGDLLIGMVTFFAVLLPGALLSLLCLDVTRSHVFNGTILPEITGEAQGWVVFIFSSYFLGHFIFLLGSHLDGLYDSTYRKYKTRKGHPILNYVVNAKARQLGDDHSTIINAYKWARVNVQLRSPEAGSEIDRLEADSKFFRSLIVVLLIACVAFLSKSAGVQAAICFVLMLLSLWRYFEQRWKFTILTYQYFVILQTAQRADRAGTKAAMAAALLRP